MPRCIICDYDDVVESILNNSLTDGDVPRSFTKDRNGDDVCSFCSAAIEDALNPSDELPEDKDFRDEMPQDDDGP